MVDFTLTDEQQSMREMAHDFADNEIRPVAWDYDRDGTWPQEIIEKAWELGLMNSHLAVRVRRPRSRLPRWRDHRGGDRLGLLRDRHIAFVQRPRDRSDRARRLGRAQEGVPRPPQRGAPTRVLLPDRARCRLRRLRDEDHRHRAATGGSSTAPSASSPTASTPTTTRSTRRPTRRPATAVSRASSSLVTPAWWSTSTRTRWASARRTPRRSRSPRSRSRSTISSARRTRASRSR